MTTLEYGQLLTQFGFGGMVLYIVVKWLVRIDHTLKGLSMALWMDLASRPYADKVIREKAKKIIASMESQKK